MTEQQKAITKSRIGRYDQYYDIRTLSTTIRKTAKPPNTSKHSKEYDIVVRRLIDLKGRLKGIEVDIKSQPLCEVLEKINENVPGLSLGRSPPVADPKLFFHSYEGLLHHLSVAKSNDPDGPLVANIETALEFTHEHHAKTFDELPGLLARKEITFDLLWALIPPNTHIFMRHELTEQDQILLASSVSYENRMNGTFAVIRCSMISNDGRMFGVSTKDLEIPSFEGVKGIRELLCFPLQYHEQADEIKQRAVKRGKRYASMEGPCYGEVSGPAMKESAMSPKLETKMLKFIAYGRVMIDAAAFRLFEPNSILNTPVYKPLDRNDLTDEQLMICAPIALGFCFGSKIWGAYAMDRLEDTVWSDEPFASLVLGAKQKLLIHSLVKQHNSRANVFDDIVRGKGKGLIGLLSGRPGCGKTLTAEAVAEVTHRPLYAIGAGELGTSPEDLDKRLSRILELAETWNAVLLLDEAEVFLQARNGSDVNRNALVSIFLRQLEYYQGILILTTNLIEQCDPAFESRIHFSVHYPDLDFASRRKIWQTFFQKASKISDVSEAELDQLAIHKMNGRQIKNTVSSAQSIAMEAKTPLSIEHVDAVIEVVSEWQFTRKKSDHPI